MYESITLSNGVRIVYEHMSAVRSAAIGIWVGVGSRFEKAGEEGSAHFIEHMLFKGTANSTAAQLAGRMDAIGGQINAFTSRDATCFFARVLDSHLKEATDILTEMFFDSLFSESDVQSERGVVLEEIDMYRDTPEDLVVEQLMAKIFPGALGKPVLGKASSLARMTGETLRDFKEREYTPGRIVVSVCGSFTDEDLHRVADRFAALSPKKNRPVRRSAYTGACVFKKKAIEQNHFCLTWRGLTEGADERFAQQVMSMILGGGMSSRLFQKVREEHGLCYSIGSFSASYTETGMFGVSTAVGRDTEEQALTLISEEIDRFVNDGLAPGELDRARELIKSSVILGLESTTSRMNRLGSSTLQIGCCLTPDELIERYNAVTADDILSLAQKMLTRENQGLSAVGRLSDGDKYRALTHQIHY